MIIFVFNELIFSLDMFASMSSVLIRFSNNWTNYIASVLRYNRTYPYLTDAYSIIHFFHLKFSPELDFSQQPIKLPRLNDEGELALRPRRRFTRQQHSIIQFSYQYSKPPTLLIISVNINISSYKYSLFETQFLNIN